MAYVHKFGSVLLDVAAAIVEVEVALYIVTVVSNLRRQSVCYFFFCWLLMVVVSVVE